MAKDNDGGKFGLSGQRRAEGITESRLPIPAPSGRLSALNTLSFELFSSGEEWALGQRGLCGLVAQPQQALNWVAGLGRGCSCTSPCPCLTPVSPVEVGHGRRIHFILPLRPPSGLWVFPVRPPELKDDLEQYF